MPSPERPTGTVTPLQSFRVTIGSVMSGLVIMAVVFTAVLGTAVPPLWWLVVPLVLGVLAESAITTAGYRVVPIPPGAAPEEAAGPARIRFQRSAVVRMAIGESVAIVSIVLSFLSRPQSVLTYLVGTVVSLVLLGRHVWPSAGMIDRTERALDASGGRSHLADVLAGREPGSSAPGYAQL